MVNVVGPVVKYEDIMMWVEFVKLGIVWFTSHIRVPFFELKDTICL